MVMVMDGKNHLLLNGPHRYLALPVVGHLGEVMMPPKSYLVSSPAIRSCVQTTLLQQQRSFKERQCSERIFGVEEALCAQFNKAPT